MTTPPLQTETGLIDGVWPEAALLPPGGIAQLFFQRARELGPRPFLHRWEGDGWAAWSWTETAARVTGVARGLMAHGVQPGDRVLLVAENRVEWQVSALGIMAARAITVPLSATATADDWRLIIASAEPRACIVSARLAKKFREVAAAAGWGGPRVEMADTASAGAGTWSELAATPGAEPTEFGTLDDLCCLIYTSGTGGTPKGVEQTHRNVLWNCVGAARNLAPYGLAGNRFLSFLPLSHTYEHTAGFISPMALGGEIFVSRGPEHFARELRLAAPTVLIVVPRFCEVMQQRIETGLARKSALARKLFAVTDRLGRHVARGGRPTVGARLWSATVGRVVRRQLAAHFGGALKAMLSAGAPLRADTAEFFNGMGLALHEAYGQTEAAPGITMQRRGAIRPGTVGPAMHGVTVRIADDGEVLVQGPNVMRGYWREPAATAAALAGGWLHTGDIGRIEADGALVIVDRKKDFLKTAGADMIAPQPIELALTGEPEIAQAMLCGEGWAHLGALVVPDVASREALAAGKTTAAAVEKRVQAAVDRVNARLSAKLRVRRIALLTEPFTVENGMLTGTLKVRRRVVLERHKIVISALRDPG
jgi:long-chain acyl-CoA synthetase